MSNTTWHYEKNLAFAKAEAAQAAGDQEQADSFYFRIAELVKFPPHLLTVKECDEIADSCRAMLEQPQTPTEKVALEATIAEVIKIKSEVEYLLYEHRMNLVLRANNRLFNLLDKTTKTVYPSMQDRFNDITEISKLAAFTETINSEVIKRG